MKDMLSRWARMSCLVAGVYMIAAAVATPGFTWTAPVGGVLLGIYCATEARP